MNDEQVKDIIVAMISKGMVYSGTSNEETGEEIAKLYKKIYEGTRFED